MKVVIFGDSITAGWTNNRVSPILKRKLEAQSLKQNLTHVRFVLHGVPAESTNEGKLRLEQVANEKADFTFIFFGANDSATYHLLTAADCALNLTSFAMRLGLDKTILLTPPYHNDEVGDLSRSNVYIEEYRTEILKAANMLSIPVIDIYQNMLSTNTPNDLLQADGLHFSELGYEYLAKWIIEKIKELI